MVGKSTGMVECLVDTDILSYYLRQDAEVIQAAASYLSNFKRLNISVVTYYEIVSGLKFKRAQKQLESFEDLVKDINVLKVTTRSATLSGDIYAILRQQGIAIDVPDVLIAGIAIERGLSLVTNNQKDYDRIDGLMIESWK